VVQLIKDLQPLVSLQTTMTANEAGNALVITDTQKNIRRIAEIIKAIDMGAEDVTEVRVFRLSYSDPSEISELLTSLFPDDSRSGGSQAPVQFGGFRRMFGGFGGAPGSGGSSGSQSQRIRKRARVIAVPDPRTSSVVVTATKDLMSQIEQVVQELDANPAHKQNMHVFQLQNADVSEVQDVLEDMFERNQTGNRNTRNQDSTLRTRSTQNNNNAVNRNRQTGGNRVGLGQ
jgi:type II secretory pathway component GspD/PulD (secretin)